MLKSKNKNLNNIIVFFLALLFIGVADGTTPNHALISITVPGILALASFIFGIIKFNIRVKESLILIAFHILFLILTFNTKVFILNIFLLSLLIWHLITPLVIRFRGYFFAAIFLPLLLSFILPYYKLQIPLMLFVYYPFYLSGYSLEGLRIKKSRITNICCIAVSAVTLVSLLLIFIKCLYIYSANGLIYIQSLYSRNTAFVYSPIIVAAFFLFSFSILALMVDRIDFIHVKNSMTINWRAASLSLCILMPVLYAIYKLQLNYFIGLGLLFTLSLAYMVLYKLICSKVKNYDFYNNRVDFEKELDINKIYKKIFFNISFIMFMVISIECVLRYGGEGLTLDYFTSTSFAYNMIFVGLIYLTVISLLGHKLGLFVMLIVHILLILANYIKIKFFGEPFFPWDTFLLNNAVMISKEYINLSQIIIAFVLMAACILLIFKNFRYIIRVIKPEPRFKLALILAIPLAFNFYLLNNDGLRNINIFKDWFDSANAEEFLRNGTYVESYYYLKDINKYLNNKPDYYSKEKMKQVRQETPDSEKVSDVKPNVIVIMSETFWDPTNLKGVQFNKGVNKNLKKYQNGTMISPKFGGGTANIEFEVLTGLSNFFFNQSIVPYNVYFKRQTPSIVDAFKSNGYSAIAIHPNGGEMYNRNKVYPHLGFDVFMDAGSFDLVNDRKGNNISDDKFIDKVIKVLKEGDGPKFVFGISMQNHDPYVKETKNYREREIEVKTDKLDTVETDILSNYSQGFYDADKALGKLIKEVEKEKRPTLIYYFGDHLPRLGVPRGIYDIYEKLGYIEKGEDPLGNIKLYQTPIVRWSNYKAMPRFRTSMSPNQVALEILKDAEIRYPDYFNYLQKLRDKYPYLSNYLYDKNKLLNEKTIKNYYLIQYDIMFGKHYIID